MGSLYDFLMTPLNQSLFGAFRSRLLQNARGATLEVGIGTGHNLPYYPKSGVTLVAIEPESSMRSRAHVRAERRKDLGSIRIQDGNVEHLDFADASFQTVVSTLVLCSVTSPAKAIAEIHRVLIPGGRMLCFEHVRRNTPFAGRVLDVLTPLWAAVFHGCHLNRDPESLFRASGFRVIEFERMWHGLGQYWVLEK